MEIIDCKQRTEPWFELKKKRMSASHATAIGNCGKGLDTYIMELMMPCYSSVEPEKYSNSDMERGNDLEDSAAMVYSFENNIEVQKVGFVLYNDYVGCSPDLFAGGDGMTEIKCINDKNYFQLLMDFKIDLKYMWQTQMQMLCCEKQWNDLVFYNPNFKKSLLVKRIYPDNIIRQKLLKGFALGEAKIKAIINRMEG